MAMTQRTKVLILVMLGVMTFAIAYAGIFPAYSELQQGSLDLRGKKEENQQYVSKLAARAKADAERHSLENQIESLRNSVPKQPELELVMLDIEHMCQECNVDLIGVEDIDAETLAKLQLQAKPQNNTQNNIFKPLTAIAPALPFGAKSDKKDVNAHEAPTFKQLTKQVYLTGDYEGFVKVLHKLESYQRVVGVNNISIAVPSKEAKDPSSLKAEKLKIKQPVMSFILSIYYLP
jgi:Tfp pilus assembly protein PilO